MKDSFYVVFNDSGARRMCKGPPSKMRRGEITIRIVATIPDEVFVQPVIGATLEVPVDHIIRPTVEMETEDAGVVVREEPPDGG